MQAVYAADRSLGGKLRRRLTRLSARRPARRGPDWPMVSITFDDAPASAVEQGRAALEARGLRGAYFVAAGLAGETGPSGRYATAQELMGACAAGHELACHTFSHLDCASADAAAIVADTTRNAEVLAAWGAPSPTTFAYPYGEVSPNAKRALGARYGLMRGLHHGLVAAGVDLNQAPAVGLEGPGGEELAHRWIGHAANRCGWLILFTHDVAPDPSPYGCTPDALARVIDHALETGADVVTVSEGLSRLRA
jgi:peptidoglycan/xylan/chitin deacetylase (PgdA/CDA1 family)